MRLQDAQELLDRCFAGVAEGAARLHEPADPRFAERLSAVWLEYRWYVHGSGLAEVFVKWKRVRAEVSAEAEAPVLRIHLLKRSPELEVRLQRALAGGTPAPERILGVFGDDGIRRECVTYGATSLTVEQWEPAGPRELLEAEHFQQLAETLVRPTSTPDERHEAVTRLSSERSPRVVSVLLGLLAARPSLGAFRVLSEWGVLEALAPLRSALAAVAPDNPADLWALTALERRLEAWAAALP